MASKPVEPPVSSWASPVSALRIDYSAEAMEEIRARAVEGFYRLTRGGVEIAGLLLGSVQDGSIRVLAQLPFEIEYAYGPVFALSPRDIAYLRKLLEDLANPHSPESAQVRGLRVLGLYVSHSRSAIALSDGERALFDQLFPHAWQTFLLLKPSRSPETAAAFFVRGADGKVHGGEPQSSFLVAPAMGERRTRPARSADSSLQALADAASNAAAPEAPARTSPPSLQSAPAGSPASSATSAPPHQAPLFNEDSLAKRALPTRDTGQAPSLGSAPEAQTPAREPLPKAPLSRVLSAALGEDLVAAEASPGPPPASALIATPPEAAASAANPVPPPVPGRVAPVAPSVPRTQAPPHQPSPAEQPEAPPPSPLPDWHDEALSPSTPRATSWLRWAIPAVGLLLLLVLGYLVYHALNSVPPSVVFYTKESGDRLEVIWQLKGLSDARKAEIAIRTADQTRRIDLIRTGQLSGTYSDPFLQRDSEVWLEVERSGGEFIRRTAPLIPADSVVAYLGGEAVGANVPLATATPEATATPNATASSDSLSPSATSPDGNRIAARPAGTLIPEPILAAPVERPAAAPKPTTPAPTALGPAPVGGASSPVAESRALTPRETAQQRIAVTTQLPAAPGRPSGALSPTRDPEAPVQARLTEAPPVVPSQPGRSAPASPAAQAQPPAARPAPATPSPATPAPENLVRPAVPAQRPTPESAQPAPDRAQPAPAKPAARPGAGRMIWTGQLRKNQSLQISGKEANQGVLNAPLPGQPVRISVLPGELTPQGLIVYTANPRYRNAQNAVEAPGPTNGWNQTRYRYDPARANSLIVTGVPSQGNNWQGISVRNDDKSTNVIVIDWQTAEP